MNSSNKIYSTFIFFLFASISLLSAQNPFSFQRGYKSPPAPQFDSDFIKGESSDAVFGDIDGDADLDLIYIGDRYSERGTNRICVYLNKGNGDFELQENTPIDSFQNANIDLGDIENDGDLDLVICGHPRSHFQECKMYRNDGLGNFTQIERTPFEGIRGGAVVFGDVDNDNDLDLFISGYSDAEGLVSMLYVNDGEGSFISADHDMFEPLHETSAAFGDLDNDGDLDLVFSGFQREELTLIYVNDGSGNFTEDTNANLVPVREGSIALSDVDNDNDLDIFSMGSNQGVEISTLYINDGNGNFQEDLNFSADSLKNGWADFADVDNDGDEDLFITGISNFAYYAHLYINDGTGEFEVSEDLQAFPTLHGRSSFADVDNDGDEDLFQFGADGLLYGSNLYFNDGNGKFERNGGTPFKEVNFGSFGFGDIDGDGDIDVIVSGDSLSGHYFTKLYLNDGFGRFIEMQGTPFHNFMSGDIKVVDIDGDDDFDLIFANIIAQGEGIDTTRLYFNDGLGNFTRDLSIPFSEYTNGVAVADFDNDNDLDIIAAHNDRFEDRGTKTYVNDGTGKFNYFGETSFENALGFEQQFADFNNDGLPDFVHLFSDFNHRNLIQIQFSNGTGFSGKTEIEFIGADVEDSRIEVGDIDNDLDLDILLYGGHSESPFVLIFKNDGNGEFIQIENHGIIGLLDGSLSLGDIDGDGAPDIIILGYIGPRYLRKVFYKNNGNGDFFKVEENNVVACYRATSKFEDIDKDGDLDLFISGTRYSLLSFETAYYFNTTQQCPRSVVYDEVQSCEPFTWIDGITYTQSITGPEFRLLKSNGCDSIIILDLEILNTSVNISQNADTLFASSNLNNVNYQWYTCSPSFEIISGATDNFLVVQNEANSYAVQARNSDCIDTSICYDYHPLFSNIEATIFKDVSVTPIPFTSALHINRLPLGATVQVFDAQGAMVYANRNSATELNIPTAKWSNGVYQIVLQHKETIQTIRAVK